MKKMPKEYGIPLRDFKLPMPGDMFDTSIDEKSEFFNHLMSMKMRDAMMSDEESTSPDKFACDKVLSSILSRTGWRMISIRRM